MKSNTIKIFGYGSLININSAKNTVPNIDKLDPVTLEGFVRVFETKSTYRVTPDNNSVAVLNIKEDPNSSINGVCFEVSKEYFDDLLVREDAYELVEVEVRCFNTNKPTNAYVFIDKNSPKEKFAFHEPIQIEYLQICLDGAKEFGDKYYNHFLETTLINNMKLNQIDEISHLI